MIYYIICMLDYKAYYIIYGCVLQVILQYIQSIVAKCTIYNSPQEL